MQEGVLLNRHVCRADIREAETRNCDTEHGGGWFFLLLFLLLCLCGGSKQQRKPQGEQTESVERDEPREVDRREESRHGGGVLYCSLANYLWAGN